MRRQKKMSERILATALSVTLCVSYVPLNVIAEGDSEETETVAETLVQAETTVAESDTFPEETETSKEVIEDSETEESISETEEQETPVQENQPSVYTLQIGAISGEISPFYEVTINDTSENIEVIEGEEVKISVHAIENSDNHYRISSVKVGNKILDVSAGIENYEGTISITPDMADENGMISISVEFTQIYVVQFSYDSTKGAVNPTMEYTAFENSNPAKVAGSVFLNTGETLGFTATPMEHYRVSEIRIDDNQESYTENDKSVIIENLDKDQNHTVEVVFSLNTYQISKEVKGEYGAVNVDSESVDYGGAVQVTVQPEEGCYIKTLSVNGVDVDSSSIQEGNFSISEITENQQIQAEFGSFAEDYSWNADTALYNQNNSYVYAKNANVTFTTTFAGIRLIDENGTAILGDETTQNISLSYQDEKIIIQAIEIYDSGLNYTEAGWHRITLENKLEISFYEGVSAEFVLPEFSKSCNCYNGDVTLGLKIDIPEGYPDIASIEYWLDGETEHHQLEKDTREILISSKENNRAGIVANAIITDTAGNTTSIVSEPFSINATVPTVKVLISDTPADGAKEGYYNKPVAFDVIISDRADTFSSSLDIFDISKDGEILSDTEKSKIITWNQENMTAKLYFSDDGVYDWNLHYTNTAGMHNEGVTEGAESYHFVVDSKIDSASVRVIRSFSQTLQDMLSTLTFGVLEKYPVTITATATDNLSGIAEISYFKLQYEENSEYSFTKPLEFEELEKLYRSGKFNNYSWQIVINPSETAVVYVRFMDKAGNIEYRSSNGIIVENQKSIVTFTPQNAPNEYGVYNGDVTVTVDVKDVFPYSGIRKVEYWVTSDGKVTQTMKSYPLERKSNDYSELQDSWSKDIIIDSDVSYGNNVELCVNVTDNAGNVSFSTEKFNIHTTTPTISISYSDDDNPKAGKYFNTVRTATVEITDSSEYFDEKGVDISIVAVDAEGNEVEAPVSISEWKNNGDKHTATISFLKDANYQLSIKYQSRSGLATSYITSNGESAPDWYKDFTIDTTPPTGTITIEPNTWDKLLNTLTFGIYGKQKLHVKFEGKDNVSPVRVCYYVHHDKTPLSKEELDDFEPIKWRMFGNNPTGEIELSAENMSYVVYMKVIDSAGNYTYICSDGHIIDTAPPKITLNPPPTEITLSGKRVYNAENASNGVPVEIIVNDADPYSGLQLVKYWIEVDNVKMEEGTLYKDEKHLYQLPEFKDTITIDTEKFNSSNVTLFVYAEDNAGNPSEPEILEMDIDITPPTIDIAYDSESENHYFANTRTATITITERASHFDQFKAEEAIKNGIRAVDAEENPVENAYMISNWNHENDVHTATISFNDDADYIVSIAYTDEAGNTSVATETEHFIIDKTVPIGEIEIRSEMSESDEIITKTWGMNDFSDDTQASFTRYFQNGVIAKVINENDNLSGICKIAYFKDNYTENLGNLKENFRTIAELEEIYSGDVEGKSFIETSDIIMDVNEKAVIYARLEDYAGNVTYLHTDGLVTDNQEPKPIIVTSDDDIEKIQNHAVKFHVDVSEPDFETVPFSGIKTIICEVKTQEGEKIGEDYIFNWNEEKLCNHWDVEFELDPENFPVYNQDNLNVDVTVIDNAGNQFGNADTNLSINTDKPEISVVFEDNFKENDEIYINKVSPYGYENYFRSRRATIEIKNDRPSSFNKEEAERIIRESIHAENITSDSGEIYTEQPEDLITFGEWRIDADDRNVHIIDVEFNYCGNYTWKNAVYTNKAENTANVLEEDELAFTIDNVAPTGSVMIETNSWSEVIDFLTFRFFDQKKFEVTTSGSDITSPYRIDYYISHQTTAMKAEELDNITNWEEYKGSFDLKTPEKYVVYVRIMDYAGNYIYVSSNGHIIDGEPCQVTADFENRIYNGDIPVDIQVFDKLPYSGIKSIEYWVKKDGIETKHDFLYQFEPKEYEYTEFCPQFSKQIEIDAKKNNSSNVKLIVKAIDNADNETKELEKNIDIDITPPSISVSYDNNHDNNGNSYFNAVRTATVTITERSNHFDAQTATDGITITAVDGNGEPVDDSYEISQWEHHTGATPDEDTHTATIRYKADANYTFDIACTDKAGNANTPVTTSSTAPFRFTVDTVPPTGTVTAISYEGRETTWEELIRTLHFGFWSNRNINISATSEDITSPVASVEYYKTSDTTALTEEELNHVRDWHSFEEMDVKPNEQFTIYLKLTDMAGNFSYISTDGMIVDDDAPHDEFTAPEINITPEQTESGIYNGSVNVAVTVDDPLVGDAYSGIRTISYKVFNMGTETQQGTLFTFDEVIPLQSNLQKTWTGEIQVDGELNNSNDVVIEIYAQDNALNSSTQTTSLKIDTTPPEITVSYNNNTAINNLFSSGRTAQISIQERNFSDKYVNLKVTRDGVADTRLLSWSSSGSGDNTVWYAELPLTQDGDYTFAIDCTDLAANKSAETKFVDGTIFPDSFTIDATKPQIDVVFVDVDKDPKDGYYYKKPRTASITINELHFDEETATKGIKVTGKNDGENVDAIISNWVNVGNTHKATVNFSEDAEYHFSVSYTDTAGNKGDTTTDDFCVDTINPSLALTVNDNLARGRDKFVGAYKDEVIPVISYNDVNFDTNNNIFIEMSGINVSVSEPIYSGDDVIFTLESEGKTLEWKATFETNEEHYGKVLTFENFPEDAEKGLKAFDDIYTLKVSLEDRAGRKSSFEREFSVNRYGSTYDTRAIQKKLNTYMQEGIIVTVKEYNPDALIRHSVELSNLPEKNVKYDFESFGEEGERHSYNYTIDKVNFDDSSQYDIELKSVDMAGNTSGNKDQNNQKEIMFWVDKNAPTVNTLNLEDGEVYTGMSREVLFLANDDLKLNNIKVYLDSETEIYHEWNAQEIANQQTNEEIEFKNQYSFEVAGDYEPHYVKIVCADASGRTTELKINYSVVPNRLVWWLRKYGWVLGILLVLVIAGVGVAVAKKKRGRDNA